MYKYSMKYKYLFMLHSHIVVPKVTHRRKRFPFLLQKKVQNRPKQTRSVPFPSLSLLSCSGDNGRPMWQQAPQQQRYRRVRGHVEGGESGVADEVSTSRLPLPPRPSLRPFPPRRQGRRLHRSSQLQRRQRLSSSGCRFDSPPRIMSFRSLPLFPCMLCFSSCFIL